MTDNEPTGDNSDSSAKSDTRLFIILGILAVATITLDVLLRLFGEGLFGPAVELIVAIADALISGVVITSLFTALEKLNVLLPIQRKIATLLDALGSRLNAQIDFVDGNQKYRRGREQYGLSDVVGLKITSTPHVGHALDHAKNTGYVGDSIIETILRELVHRKDKRKPIVVSYMNTYVEQSDELSDLLYDAALSGLTVQILIMDPDNPALVSRFEDAYKKLTRFDEPSSFIDHVRKAAQQLRVIEAKISAEPDQFSGKVHVRFQHDLGMNYPLLAISEQRDNDRLQPIKIYTGFYGAQSSERLPYIEWCGGEFGLCERLMMPFVQKWRATTPNVDTTENKRATEVAR